MHVILVEWYRHLLLDVRKEVQFGICKLPGSVNIPLSLVAANYDRIKTLAHVPSRGVDAVTRSDEPNEAGERAGVGAAAGAGTGTGAGSEASDHSRLSGDPGVSRLRISARVFCVSCHSPPPSLLQLAHPGLEWSWCQFMCCAGEG